MRIAARSSGEPVGPVSSPTGFDVSGALAAVLPLVAPVAGAGVVAIVLAGSHASGEGVWATLHGRTISLSDLDVYAVLEDEPAVRAAQARSRQTREGLRAPLAALGFVAPLEMGFLTRAGLSRMPARPGVIELRRHGRVLEGEATVLATVPAWSGADVSLEEQVLLLENRGFELLLSAPGEARDATERLLNRHATLKTALDLAGVMALWAHEWPVGVAGRLACARRDRMAALRERLPKDHEGATDVLDVLWEVALAFRATPQSIEGEASAREWRQVVHAWCAVSGATSGMGAGALEPWPGILTAAARAPWRRRVRQAISFHSRTGAGPGLSSRLRHIAAGTPMHRVHGSASVLLHAASLSGEQPMLPAEALRALALLGVTRARDWEGARLEVVQAWDRWLQLGQRTQGSL
ncbi:MAG: hypothetical protein ABIU54_04945 [Candidatus Eisenbacteria bacterium]